MIDADDIFLQTQFAFEAKRSVRKLWFYKMMEYIYETFFQDPNFQDNTYRYKDDKFLLSTVCIATCLILGIFCVKLSTYFYYKRSIQNQIQVVNNKLKSMQVSIDIVKKIIVIHECIVRNQQEMAQLRHKKTTELPFIGKDEYDEVKQKKSEQGNDIDHVPKLESSKTRKNTDTGFSDKEHISEPNFEPVGRKSKTRRDSYIEPVSRKSKTRYTVICVKSRSQPNIQNLTNSCDTEVNVKRRASDTALSCDSYSSIEDNEKINKQLVEVEDASNHTDLTDFIKYVHNSSVHEDIKSCSNQIVEFLNDFEASLHDTNFCLIPMEKHVEIKVLFEILVGQINDQMKEIRRDLFRI